MRPPYISCPTACQCPMSKWLDRTHWSARILGHYLTLVGIPASWCPPLFWIATLVLLPAIDGTGGDGVATRQSNIWMFVTSRHDNRRNVCYLDCQFGFPRSDKVTKCRIRLKFIYFALRNGLGLNNPIRFKRASLPSIIRSSRQNLFASC